MAGVLKKSRLVSRPLVIALWVALGTSTSLLVGCATTASTSAEDAEIDANYQAYVETNKKLSELRQIKDIPTRITARQQYINSTSCNQSCKYTMKSSLADDYNQAKKFGEARELLWDLFQTCKARKDADIKKGTANREDCGTYQAKFDLATAQLVPQNDEGLKILKDNYEKSPTPSIGESYLIALRHKGMKEEAEKEEAYQKKIAVPLNEMQDKLLFDILGDGKEKDPVAKEMATAEKYQMVHDLYQAALEATSKSGLTQHDEYLRRVAGTYSNLNKSYLKLAEARKQEAEYESKARQRKAAEPKEESDTFGTVLGALFTGLAMGSTSSNAPAFAAIGSALSGSGSSRAPSPSALTSSALSSLPSNASTKQILGTVFAATMAETAARSEEKSSAIQAASLSSAGENSTSSSGVSGSVSSAGSSYTGTGCPTNLAHLDSKLPRYNSPTLQKIRQAVLTENIPAAYQKALSMGHTPAQASSLSLQQAREYEKTRQESKSCINQASTSPAAIIAQLENGTYNMNVGSKGIVQACAENYVLMYYGAVANKEIAAAFACMAQK